MPEHIATLAGPIEDFSGLLEAAGRATARVSMDLLDSPLRPHLAAVVAALVQAAESAGLSVLSVPEPDAPAVVLLRTLGRLAEGTAGRTVVVPSGAVRDSLARLAASGNR